MIQPGDRVYYVPPLDLHDDHYEGVPCIVLVAQRNFYFVVRVTSHRYVDFPHGTIIEPSLDQLIPLPREETA